MAYRHRVVFPQHARGRDGIEITVGATLRDHALELGILIPSACGGRGQCGKCMVRVDRGMAGLAEKTLAELASPLGREERLACQARVRSDEEDIHLYLKAVGDYTILTDSLDAPVPLDPYVCWQGDAVFHRGTAGRSLGCYEGELLGLAIDVGTTTLAAQVIDLETGTVITSLACKNPQAAFGDDVISRIAYTDQHSGGDIRLQTTVVEAVNGMLRGFDEGAGRRRSRHIYEAVVVGNPTMREIFFGRNVHSLGTSPYEPGDTSPVNERAAVLGLDINPAGNIYGAPLVAGQVGADTVALILASDMHVTEQPSMAVDIGTNGEVAVGNSERILAASNAAGGAFEGGTVACGTGAIRGAIASIVISGGDGRLAYETIGGSPPIGICGSGLIDLLAETLRNGIIDKRGRLSERYRRIGGFRVADDSGKISISQRDINELRLARAGSALNQQTLMKEYGVDLDGLSRICLAGGFANYVNLESAVAIGVLPDAGDKLVKIGNGALAGARQMLLCRQRREDAERLAPAVVHVKLSEQEGFLDSYVAQLQLGRWP
jgi:uncharacterized 2Fe-2S/4Fe-4S cluster protein (DUF4445 family)